MSVSSSRAPSISSVPRKTRLRFALTSAIFQAILRAARTSVGLQGMSSCHEFHRTRQRGYTVINDFRIYLVFCKSNFHSNIHLS
jgi:hypothetical protein